MRVLLLVVAVALAGCQAPVDDPAAAPGSEDRRLAPEYAASDLNGTEVSLAELRGEPVLMYIWATWCTICKQEGPEVAKLHEDYAARGLNVLAVSIDAPGSEEHVRDTAAERGYPFRILLDPEDVVRPAFGVRYQPNTILIDREGYITNVWSGPIPGGADGVRADIEATLA